MVVVLPLVPVTASHGRRAGRASAGPRRGPQVHRQRRRRRCSAHQASSTSPITGIPACSAAVNSGVSGRQPGEVTTRSVPGGGAVIPATTGTGTAQPPVGRLGPVVGDDDVRALADQVAGGGQPRGAGTGDHDRPPVSWNGGDGPVAAGRVPCGCRTLGRLSHR